MDKVTDIVKAMPKMLAGSELVSALTVLPEYDESIRKKSEAVRLMALSDLYRIYLPSQMSLEIYSKLYLALLRSLQKKETDLAIKQRYENHKAIQREAYNGIIGGSDSFTIIGHSGIGKSSAISRAIFLIAENNIIELNTPYTKIIPCLVVQCPFDASIKQLLLEILRKVDERLGTKYYHHAVKNRAYTTDVLIGTVSTVAINNIGILIVDEIQNVVNSKNGKILIGALTALINNSGISICMVGTPESAPFFEQAMQLARRSLGLQYDRLGFDQYFHDFCCTLYRYQYVRHQTEITPAVIEWLYEHSSGLISVVVSLIHDAQEIAILNGTEALNMETLNEAYKKRLSLLHGYIQQTITQGKQTSTVKKETPATIIKSNTGHVTNVDYSIAELVAKSKVENLDIVQLLKEKMIVVEVLV